MGHNTCRRSQKTRGMLCALLIAAAIFFLVYGFSYHDGLTNYREECPVYYGTCTDYRLEYEGKSGYEFYLTLDNRLFFTPLAEHINKDFYDEIQVGDCITVSYVPKQKFFLFRIEDSLMSIEKNGKQYLDTNACIRNLRTNGWFCFGFALLLVLIACGFLFPSKNLKKRRMHPFA